MMNAHGKTDQHNWTCAICDGGPGNHCSCCCPNGPVREFPRETYPGQAPCPHCFESSGYVWEHGNDWNTGPWSNQTNTPCPHCNGTGTADSPLATLDDLENLALDEAESHS